jgi:hypothetical protein
MFYSCATERAPPVIPFISLVRVGISIIAIWTDEGCHFRRFLLMGRRRTGSFVNLMYDWIEAATSSGPLQPLLRIHPCFHAASAQSLTPIIVASVILFSLARLRVCFMVVTNRRCLWGWDSLKAIEQDGQPSPKR